MALVFTRKMLKANAVAYSKKVLETHHWIQCKSSTTVLCSLKAICSFWCICFKPFLYVSRYTITITDNFPGFSRDNTGESIRDFWQASYLFLPQFLDPYFDITNTILPLPTGYCYTSSSEQNLRSCCKRFRINY